MPLDDSAPVDRSPAGVGEANATFAATLVDEWVRGGLTDAVVCPGSRSTPLAVALAADGRVRVHVHHDERSGSFLALGLGRATGRPAVVVTTSGTAAAELHPAVVEADLDRVPLLAVTADRPPELRDIGAPQTIDQDHLFGASPRWYADPGPPDGLPAGSWRGLAARALLEAAGPPRGPVHLNLPFREPLLGAVAPLPAGRPDGAPWHRRLVPGRELAARDRRALAAELRSRRGVIVAGSGVDDVDGVLALADALGWPVLADPRSGCRVPHDCVVAHADALLRLDGPHRHAEHVLRLGGPASSKVMAQWLAGLDGPQTLVDRDGSWLDPSRTASTVLAVEPGRLCRQVLGELGGHDATAPRDWARLWRRADDAVEAAVAELLDAGPPSEPGTARAVARAVPDGGSLVVSSSMPVRDLEWFADRRAGLTVHANRGANGIDGVVSTAVGVALAGAPTALLVGDVALLHDTNGLLGLARRPAPLCVVVVDNDGGGIFSFLPQATALDEARFEQIFGTPHGVDLVGLAEAHGLPARVLAPDDRTEDAVAAALRSGRPSLVVVRTDRGDNVACHDDLHRAAAAAATEVLAGA